MGLAVVLKPERGGGNVLLGFRTSFTEKKQKTKLSYLLWLKRREFRRRCEQRTAWEMCDGSVEIKTIPTKKLMEGPSEEGLATSQQTVSAKEEQNDL